MKKFWIVFIILMVSVLAACSADASDGQEEPAESTEAVSGDSEETMVEDEEENEAETMTSEENESNEASVGDIVTNEAGESTLVSRTDDVGTFESGPINLTVEKANGVSMAVNDEFVDIFGSEQVEYIQVDLHVENTSEDTISFYASQAVMTTSTGEQLEPDMWMSDHIAGDYFGAVNKSGTSIYFLENSKAEDVESIRLIFSAPIDEDWENVGDEIDIEIDLNK